MSFDRDHLGRSYSPGPVGDNDSTYGEPVEGEPLERARRRAASVGPLTNNTAGTPVWIVSDRSEAS